MLQCLINARLVAVPANTRKANQRQFDPTQCQQLIGGGDNHTEQPVHVIDYKAGNNYYYLAPDPALIICETQRLNCSIHSCTDEPSHGYGTDYGTRYMCPSTVLRCSVQWGIQQVLIAPTED